MFAPVIAKISGAAQDGELTFISPVVEVKKVLFLLSAAEVVLPQDPADVVAPPKIIELAICVVYVPKFALPVPTIDKTPLIVVACENVLSLLPDANVKLLKVGSTVF
ncbi:hypothetical protein D3C87_1304600 [compost metagenome]